MLWKTNFCGKLFLHPQETCGIRNRSIILGVTCLCFFYMSNNSFLSSSMHPISIQAFTLRKKESCFSLSQFFSHLWVWMQVLRIYQWFTVLTGLTSDAFVIGSSSLLSCGDGGLRISLKRGITVCTAFLFWNWSNFLSVWSTEFFSVVCYSVPSLKMIHLSPIFHLWIYSFLFQRDWVYYLKLELLFRLVCTLDKKSLASLAQPSVWLKYFLYAINLTRNYIKMN